MCRKAVKVFTFSFFIVSAYVFLFGNVVLTAAPRQKSTDFDVLSERIEQSKKYLLTTIDPELGGVHKYYYAATDTYEDRLHTVYTASTIYTLLKLYDLDKDELTWSIIEKSTKFLLSMQNLDKKSKAYGAFYYSYFPTDDMKENRFVVGTTSKTIFTLLVLYQKTGREEYLTAAKLGGNWLIKMVRKNGSVKSSLKLRGGKWFSVKKESLLYDGQVLSALSRLYRVTKDKQYSETAKRIANRLANKVEGEGCYLGDDYRTPNPISSSWVVLSLLDYYKASGDKRFKDIVFGCSRELLPRQILDENDGRYGRWRRAFSASGNGWIAEVLTEVYDFCLEEGGADCGDYLNSALKSFSYIQKNTYTNDNVDEVKNPERAIGGIFWNEKNKYVRTDTVCHGMNAYIGASRKEARG